MSRFPAVWPSPAHHLRAVAPDAPVFYFAPAVLQGTARRFRAGFPGLVTYAVKANDAAPVLENLVAAGLAAFDVASPDEMARVRQVCPRAVLHYNNPVRSGPEIAAAARMGVVSASVDEGGEFAKLARAFAPGTLEVAVRIKLPVAGAAYDFGEKFGMAPGPAAELLGAVAAAGYAPAITFHPGTQCADPAAWAAYIRAAAEVARAAGVRLARLNVGGGFPAQRRAGEAPDLEAIFAAIGAAVEGAFGAEAPALVCEPGRAMVAEAFALGTRVKAVRADGTVFLNDGIYGGLSEFPSMGGIDRVEVLDAAGRPRPPAPARPRVVFGPTCDSLDRLPGSVSLPETLAEGDVLLFRGLGAYSTATATRFNGYGAHDFVAVQGFGGNTA